MALIIGCKYQNTVWSIMIMEINFDRAGAPPWIILPLKVTLIGKFNYLDQGQTK